MASSSPSALLNDPESPHVRRKFPELHGNDTRRAAFARAEKNAAWASLIKEQIAEKKGRTAADRCERREHYGTSLPGVGLKMSSQQHSPSPATQVEQQAAVNTAAAAAVQALSTASPTGGINPSYQTAQQLVYSPSPAGPAVDPSSRLHVLPLPAYKNSNAEPVSALPG